MMNVCNAKIEDMPQKSLNVEAVLLQVLLAS